MEKAVSIFCAAALSFFVVSASVIFTLNFRGLYYFDVRSLDIPLESGMSISEIRENYDAVIDYMGIFRKKELVLPTLPMSENGRIHFAEVKNIFIFFEYALLISFVAAAGLSVFLIRRKIYGFLKTAALITGALPIILGIAMFFWDWFFVAFHKIFFNNDFWVFEENTDPIIKILPDAFFLHCALLILAVCLFCSAACFVIYKYCAGFEKNSKIK